jgi:hypothetical protein
MSGRRLPGVASRLAGSAAVVIALFILHVRLFGQFPRNADTFSSYLLALDVAHGNWRLAGWWLAPNNFLTSDVFFYAALIRLFGDHLGYVVYLSVGLWLATGLAAYVLARRGTSGPGRAWAALPILVLLGLPMFQNNPVMVLITSCPMHIGSILYACALFIVADEFRLRRGWRGVVLLAGLGLLAAAGVAGDPFVLFVGVLPLVTASLLPSEDRRGRHAWLAAVAAAGAIAGHVAVRLNAAHGGAQTVGGAHLEMVFVPFGGLADNASLIVHSILRLFGADFFGQGVATAIPALVRLPLLVMATGIALAFVREWPRRLGSGARSVHSAPTSFLDALLVLAIAFNIASGVFSRVLVDMWSARYFLPTLVFAAVLLGRRAPRRRSVAVLYGAALCVSLLVSVHGYAHAKTPMALATPRAMALTEWLIRRRMTDGFGSYWTASVVTAMSRGQVRLRAVTKNGGGRLVPYLWVSRSDWYPVPLDSRRPFFVVVETKPGEDRRYEQPSVEATFGPPSETHDVEEYRINLYR